MARGRILKKTITTSEKVNKLSDKFALLYSWLIPFQDDFGLVWASVNKIKWIVAPARRSLKKKDIAEFLKKIIDLKLIRIVSINNKKWIWFPDFLDKQTLKKDRKPNTYLDGDYDWDFLDKISNYIVKDSNGFQMEDNGFQVEKQDKISKDKLSKDNTAGGKPPTREDEKKLNKQIAYVFNLFKQINPLINFGHKTNRKAVEELLALGGLEKTEKLVKYAISVQGQQYAPTITTPYQLKEKLAQLKIYYNKNKKSNDILW